MSTIQPEQYVRTLAHYLRTNERRFLGAPAAANNGRGRNVIPSNIYNTAVAYNPLNIVSGFLGYTEDEAATLAVDDLEPPRRPSTGGIEPMTPPLTPSHAPPNYPQAAISRPIALTIDPIHLYFLLIQFENIGQDIGDPAIVGSPPEDGLIPTSPSLRDEGRPSSIRSISSIASNMSTLSLLPNWALWAAKSQVVPRNVNIEEEVLYIYRVFTRVPGIKLVMPAIGTNTTRRTITAYPAFPPAHNPLALLSFSFFRNLTQIELVRMHPRLIDGWDYLQERLVVLTVRSSSIEMVEEVTVEGIVKGVARRKGFLDPGMLPGTEKADEQTQENSTKDEEKDEKNLAEAKETTEPDLQELLDGTTPWRYLTHLSLPSNNLTYLNTYPFLYLRSITHLDLSHNMLISPPAALAELYNLHHLDLSHNMIETILGINTVLGNVTNLDLRGNRIDCLRGLERVWALERIDVRENRITDWAEVGRLADLPGIRDVWCADNPFVNVQRDYRLKLFTAFKSNGLDVTINGSAPGVIERRSIIVIPRAGEDPVALPTSSASTSAVASPINSTLASPSPSIRRASTNSHSPALSRSSTFNSVTGVPIATKNKKKPKRMVSLDEDFKNSTGDPSLPILQQSLSSSPPNDSLAPPALPFQSSSSASNASRKVHRLAELEHSMNVAETPIPVATGQKRKTKKPKKPNASPVSALLVKPPPTVALTPEVIPEEGDEFRRRIEALRSEGGSSWLKVLGELDIGVPKGEVGSVDQSA